MLIVIMIISILFVAFKSFFQIKNKESIYGQICIERIYGDIHEFLTAGLQSKAVNIDGKRIFPERYIIQFNSSTQTIGLSIVQWSEILPYQTIVVNNNHDEYCENQRYYTQMTGQNYRVHINKGLQENANHQNFYISDIDSWYQWETVFIQCDKISWWCIDIARFQTDTRIMNIDKYICLATNTTGQCKERDQ